MIRGVCRLCQQEAHLTKSHIIPEFFYKPLYDPSAHRFDVVSTTRSSRMPKFLQKGLRQPLLCKDCEGKLSRWERYTRDLVFGGNNHQETYSQTGHHTSVFNIDYKRFKLFQMSILWRAGVSTHLFFSKVSLGPHEEVLRDRLLNEDPGASTDYSCVVALLTIQGKVFPHIITEPVVRRIDGRHLYVFVFGSMFWVFSVSCLSHPLPPELREYVLKEDGSLKLLSGDINQSRYFQCFFQGIGDAQPEWLEP